MSLRSKSFIQKERSYMYNSEEEYYAAEAQAQADREAEAQQAEGEAEKETDKSIPKLTYINNPHKRESRVEKPSALKKTEDEVAKETIEKAIQCEAAIKAIEKGRFFIVTILDGSIDRPRTIGTITSTDIVHGDSVNKAITVLRNNFKIKLTGYKKKLEKYKHDK